MKDLYLISTKTLQYPADLDRSEHGLEPLRRGCIIKVGEAIDADVRVETLDGTFVFEKPTILKGHREICNVSLINWVFDTEKERDIFYEYMNTKTFRVAVSLVKNKKHVYKNVFSLVTHIDFSKLEKVDDENIYKYLNLTDEDIQTIEERCERLKLIKK